MFVITGVEMVSGRADPAERRVTAEPDRKVDELRGSGRSAAHPSGICGSVQCLKGCRVLARRGQCQVPGFHLGQHLDLGQGTMNLSAPRRTGIGVDTAS